MRLYQVHIFNATCGLEVAYGTVVHASPFLKKSVGLPFTKVEKWVKEKGGSIHFVREYPDTQPAAVITPEPVSGRQGE